MAKAASAAFLLMVVAAMPVLAQQGNEKEREMTSRERDLDIREEAVRRMRRESRAVDDRDLRDRRRSRVFVDENTGQRFFFPE